jgi:catechol 2,3-dioxygenase-like lactoylglutathione lyase family enzyme
MLGNADVVATIGVKDIEVARKFYEDVLGLTVVSEMPEAMLVIYRSGSSQLQIYQTELAGTNQATAATWGVSDIGAVTEALRGKGVSFEHYPDMPDVTLEGDVHVWEGQKVAWFKDPDGNILCVHNGE